MLRGVQAVVVVAVTVAIAQVVVRAPTLWTDSLSSISPLGAGSGEVDARLRADAALPEVRWLIALERPTRQQPLEQAEALCAGCSNNNARRARWSRSTHRPTFCRVNARNARARPRCRRAHNSNPR